MKVLTNKAAAFRGDDRGNIAIMFGLIMFAILAAAGATIDFLRIERAKTVLAEAGDAALIAAARYKGTHPAATDDDITAIAQKLFLSEMQNAAEVKINGFNIVFNGAAQSFRLSVDADLDLLIMDIFGFGFQDVDTVAEAKLGEPPYIELAMALDVTGSMNSNGKLSTLKTAANDLIDSLLGYEAAKAKIGIAPFAQYVNIGAEYGDEFWLDNPGGAWSGCVGSRNYPYNVKDVEYDIFRVPGVNGAACPDSLVTLTDDADFLKDKIDDLKASGWTYIPSGTMWAWSILSPQPPFTEGVAYGSLKGLNGTKALMIMTDGDNTRAPDYPTHNSASKTLANSLTKEVCTNIKAEKIVVYTVAFEVTDAEIKDILRNCATDSSYYFDAQNSKALTEAFASIAASLGTDDGRHVLVDDPDGRHRVWLIEDVRAHGSAFLIPFDDDFGARLHSLQRLHRRLTGKRTGPPLRSLRLSPLQRARLTLQVRALDGEQAGASRREIASVLLDPSARTIPAIEWKNAALRKKVNRVVASAIALMNGGYLMLLRGDPARAKRFRRR